MMPLARQRQKESLMASAIAGRILAIDYGRKRIGLAISDGLGVTAQPLAVLTRKNRTADMKRLREICTRYSVSQIIVGYPVHITGELSEMADEASRFAGRLTKALGIETELIDERLTTWEARQTLSETKGRSAGKRAVVDDVAAAVLLRDYLEQQREAVSSTTERD
jgi:putative Holliday junction resolvase